MKKPLIVIAGPTACGKSAVSVELAKIINGEIISADSMRDKPADLIKPVVKISD